MAIPDTEDQELDLDRFVVESGANLEAFDLELSLEHQELEQVAGDSESFPDVEVQDPKLVLKVLESVTGVDNLELDQVSVIQTVELDVEA